MCILHYIFFASRRHSPLYCSGMPRICSTDKPLWALIFYSWLFVDPTAIDCRVIEQTTSIMLHQAPLADLVQFVETFVIEEDTIFSLRRKLRSGLKEATDQSLENLLSIMNKLGASNNLALRLEMIAESVDVKIVIACSRQLDHGHRKFDRNIFHVAVHRL
jgi:hypothetical protein